MLSVEIPAGTIEYDVSGPSGHGGPGRQGGRGSAADPDPDPPTVVLLHGLLQDHRIWDRVLPLLPDDVRYVRPVLPLGSHRIALRPGTRLDLRGLAQVVADLLEALDLHDVTLVHSDWGGALFLTAYGLDSRVGSQIVLPCEAFDNFPPGLPGRMAALAARLPGGLRLAAHQLRIGWLRRTPPLFGWMARIEIPDEWARAWTEPILTDAGVRRDLLGYARSPFVAADLIAATERVRDFTGPVLVLWSPDNRVMPPAHGRRLADLFPAGRLVEIPRAYVLSMLDEPEAVAAAMTTFLSEHVLAPRPAADS